MRPIIAAVDVPVSVDLEAGYGQQPADLIAGLLDAGGVGLNVEDTVHSEGGRVRTTALWIGDSVTDVFHTDLDFTVDLRVEREDRNRIKSALPESVAERTSGGLARRRTPFSAPRQ